MISTTFNSAIGKSLIAAAFIFLSACSSEPTTTVTQETKDTTEATPPEQKNDDGFYDIPQPIQQVQLLQDAGAGYDKSLLNPLDNVSKYSVTNSKALNLGVYGADLSYAAVFNKSQDAILYLTVSQKLAESLNIKSDFYTQTMKWMEKSGGNRDSLLRIVSFVYKKSNESLKENDQSHVSALVVAGSFIEAMYIGTQVAKNVQDKAKIYERIGQFKGSLNNLVGLITTVHEDGFSDVLSDLKSIKAIYDETQDAKLSEDQMVKITKQVKAIRIKITNM